MSNTVLSNAEEQGPVLVCSNVAKTYEEGPETVQVLSDVNLEVQPRQRLAIVGSSGSGKTTLLNILAGLDSPTSGNVLLQGEELSSLNETARARLRNRNLGFVYQFHHLLPEFSALENVAMPLLIRKELSVQEAQRRSVELLEQVGLGHRIKHRPAELSGGERQRVAIARALVGKPSLVLMDEPTGNLDPHTAEKVHEVLVALTQEVATSFIVVTHDMEFAHSMDEVYQLSEGALIK
ncbi:lipoprotein-releasing ABC transporter ATP-binding protein LolD [Endozoicomonadaceae bacterium StTr2]